MEQLHKKLEFVEYLFRCSHNSIFLLELSVWSWNRLAKKRGAELKKRGAESPKHPLKYTLHSPVQLLRQPIWYTTSVTNHTSWDTAEA